MSRRISKSEIELFVKLYDELGTYAAVAKATRRSASCVAKYIKIEQAKMEKPQVIIINK